MDYNVPTNVGMDFSLRKIPTRKGAKALKIIVAMKLIALLVLLSFQVTASVYSQRISLTVRDMPLREVLQSIRLQSGYSFFIETDNLTDTKPVNLNLSATSIHEALDKIFENQPFTYTIQNEVIVVTRRRLNNLSGADFLTFDNGGPDSTKVVYVQGKVVDDKGLPLVGVSIRVKGGGTGTVTNPDGSYNLKTNAAATLVFSYIGYLTKEVKAAHGEIDVVLKQMNTALDQVQVIAYGTTTKRTSTGNIATVDAETIEKQPVSNPLLALQGRVPGLFIRQTTGISAGNVNVNIQGINSLAQGTAPFFVVDGVPYPPQLIGSSIIGGAIVGSYGSTLTYINPSDIESVSILKDADATAIYGSRAANGAILITTKKGKMGNTKVDFNLQTGWGKVPKELNMLNTKDYIALRLEGKKNDNAPILQSDYDINGTWDPNRYTDWQKVLVGGTATFTNLQAAVSGGSENTQFRIGGGYLKETTVYPGDFADIKGNAHFNLNHRSKNQRFKLNFSGTYLQDDITLATVDLMKAALTLAPNAPSLYNDDGTLNWGNIPGTSIYTFNNPLNYLLRKFKGSTNNLTASSNIGYSIFPGLDLNVTLGYNRLQSNETSITPQAAFNPNTVANQRSAALANKYSTSWIIEPQLKYSKSLNIGRFDILLGSSFQQTKNYALETAGGGFSNDAQLQNIQAAPLIVINSLFETTYRYNGAFSRLSYNLHDKYLLTLAGRRDGSTRFGTANRFANFYSLAGAWIFSEESIFKGGSLLSLGKLRLSYGTTGNDQIQDYLYLALYNSIPVTIPYQQAVGLQSTRLSNPYLQWELTKKTNVGLDLGFLDNRIFLSANYYINRSSNQLVNYPLGLVTGFSGINKNIEATIQNKGFELQVDVTPLKQKKLTWNISANLTIQQNKLIKFDSLQSSPLASSYVIGRPVNIMRVYQFLGVNPQTGSYQYLTQDGKTTSSPNYVKDRTQLMDINPKYYGGITNTLSFKGITLDFTFQFVKQIGPTQRITALNAPGSMSNMPTAVSDRWHSPGDNTTYQKAGNPNISYYSLALSTAAYEDASYIKLRSACLSYSIPNQWLKKIKVNYAKIFLQGQNLLTISKFFGIDPEVTYIGTLPPLRVITIGANITL
ncbi:SusC/RagA family TonB-linked outer membrane protein [Chitinophaga qingshengii]|uniref:SusC/RagA family TonB-linked outer membrane protein n=1 Tax=Chitinophaga qingshengii TaxID=1569794 RepID=A0ABR7TVJ9_9BACT|nr:SusC/RagA family TonB-linked outer membrane protein [Chitinophaga qingshengii]MBC9934080.1 SusC/RagA family TonB-linked outer membrane protein [Chitinophaga qingshengii]